MRIMAEDFKLATNLSEMTSAIHVLQGFVIQHMLHRCMPGEWGTWFGDQERGPVGTDAGTVTS
jgi:hypothetical protein